MKELKRRLNLYSFFDFPSIERHLEKMAEKGWLLVKADSGLWKYRRMQPKKLRFAITYFARATNIDPEPSEELRTLWEFCARTGWKLAAQSAQMQIFYNEGEDPIPLETDPVAQVDNIHRAAKRSPLKAQGILFLAGLINLAMQVNIIARDPVTALSSSSTVISLLCWLLVMLLCAVEVGAYFVWYRRAKAAAGEGWLLPPRGTYKFQIFALIFALGLLAYWLISSVNTPLSYAMFGICYAALLFLGVRGMMLLLKRLKVPAKVNIAVSVVVCFAAAMILVGGFTRFVIAGRGAARLREQGAVGTYQHDGMEWAIYDDELPVALEDLTGEEYAGYISRCWQDGTLLLEKLECYQRPRYDQPDYGELPRLSYTIVKVKAGFLYGMAEEAMLAEDDRSRDWVPEEQKALYQPDDPAPWGAEEAYRLVDPELGPRGQYLLCYEDRIAELDLDSLEPTAEQMETIGEEIKGA